MTGWQDGRLHSAVLVSPGRERRGDRKLRKAAARARMSEDREARRTEAKRKADALTAEKRSTVTLPRAGEPGPAALRTPGRFRLPRHQDTSATLAGAYPFLAEGGLGSEGVFVGQDLYSGSSFVYDPWILYARGLITAPNLVLAGIVGSGKSCLAKSLYTRSIPFGRRVYVPGDPKGEHTAVAEAVGGRAIALGHGMPNRLNPLDEGHRPSGYDDAQWASQIASRRRDLVGALAETVLERRLTPLEHTAVDIAIDRTVRGADVPVLPMVVDRLLAPDPADDPDSRLTEDGRLVGHALRRLVAGDLAGLFDGPSTVTFDPSLPMISLDLSRVTENATLISVLMTCASAWMESALLDPNGRPALGRVRRGLAAHVPPRAAAADGRPLAARAALRHREHADLPQAHRPRQRRRLRLRHARARLVAARERRDPDRLPPGSRPARRDLGSARAHRHRAVTDPHPRHRPGTVADQEPLLRRPAPDAPRRARALRHHRTHDRRHRVMTTQVRGRAAREAKLEALQEQLSESVAALVTGEDWKRALTFAAQFRGRSFGNSMLIAAQHFAAYNEGRVPEPTPTYVAGFHQWLSLGRSVAKGQHGYGILAPVTGRFASFTPDDPNSWRRLARNEKPMSGEYARTRMIGVKPTYVWDISQTTGDPVPELPRPTLLQGQAPAGLWDGLADQITAAGFELRLVSSAAAIGGANGLTDFLSREVSVRMDMDEAAQVKTLAHELGHVLLHAPREHALSTEVAADATLHRGIAEVEAESVALMVGAAHGLDTSSYTVPYVSTWAASVPGKNPVEVVQSTAERVRATALGILDQVDTQQVGDGNPPGLDREALSHRTGTAPVVTDARRDGAVLGL